jgi:hypothetical protein
MQEKRSNTRRLLIWSSLLLVATAGVIVALGCYPGEINSVTELDVVFTMFDSTHVWTDPATFYLSDSVVQLQDTADAGNNITLSHAFDSLILAETARGLLGYGFTQVDSSADPDYYVVLLVRRGLGLVLSTGVRCRHLRNGNPVSRHVRSESRGLHGTANPASMDGHSERASGHRGQRDAAAVDHGYSSGLRSVALPATAVSPTPTTGLWRSR